MTPLQSLAQYGQSIWLDYIRRSLLTGGEMQRLIDEDGVKGITSNPAIFEKAIAGSTDYTAAIAAMASDKSLDTKHAYEKLAIQDIQGAADYLASVYEATDGEDGYVSMEVSPRLAHDTDGTLAEARRLWQAVARPNLMIKVPATAAGLPAIETLLAEGINVNVTLLFSTEVYEQVAEHYIRGLERLVQSGHNPKNVASVASFFISRIDSAADILLDQLRNSNPTAEQLADIERAMGNIAIANAKLAYQRYKDIFGGERWSELLTKGARPQRLLWASTGTKNPAYTDVLYINELIGPETVNTVPPTTLDAFRDHGRARPSLEEKVDEAYGALDILTRLNISLTNVTDKLLDEGLELFVVAFDKLLAAVETAREQHSVNLPDKQHAKLPDDFQSKVDLTLIQWQQQNKSHRLWARDPWLWTGKDESRWLDWLDVTTEQLEHVGDLQRLVQFAEGKYFKHAVLLGMGGSSLAPDVLRSTFGVLANYPDWIILDSTDPAQVKAVEDQIDYEHTLFLVSSKSGSTLEPNILKDYFFSRASEKLGTKQAAYRFGAVTDPGSNLHKMAKVDGFRSVFYGKPCIGGRYSALSNFGMVPAAAMGLDVAHFLERATEMTEACAACVPVAENPGIVLGVILGIGASMGRDKITLVLSPGINNLGAWLEQLLAESTGKQGKGLIPVDGEQLAHPENYGHDRLFVYLSLKGGIDAQQDAAINKLEQAGLPVVRISVDHIYDLGQEFFRWEIATAVASSVLNINAFDQPDVEASKIATRKLTSEFEVNGVLAEESPFITDDNFKLYADPLNISALTASTGSNASVAEIIKAHLQRCGENDYFALLAYVNRLNPAHHEHLQSMRHLVRDSFKVATCVGFGPRFLHSTGQAYKGGPNSGVFLQITCDDASDLSVPSHKYSFGVVKAAQARGDFEVLVARQRRALRVHLGSDTVAGLDKLQSIFRQASS